MKYFSLTLPLLTLIVLISNCNRFEYNNPLDPEGINKSKFESDSAFYYLGDDDNDGIENVIDDDHILNKDTAAPTIIIEKKEVTIDNGSNEQLNHYLKEWDAQDNGGGTLTKHEPIHSVNIYKDSCYIVQYSATDEDGNTGTGTRTICVVTPTKPDTTPPILRIDDTLYTIPLNSSFTYPKSQAFDLKDGDISSRIEITGSVDTSTVGEYILTYSVKDFAGNISTRTIKVIVIKSGSNVDIVIPVIELVGDDTVKVPENVAFDDFKPTWTDPGVKATDNVDGDISDKVTKTDFTYQNPKYWYIAYNVADKSGNHAQEVKRYFDTGLPEDLQGPIIELVYPDSIIEVILGSEWKDPGYSASDIIDKNITDNVVVDNSDLIDNIDVEGYYSITYTVKNSQGVQTSVVRKVRVVDSGIDTKPPVITLNGRNPDTVLVQSSEKYIDPGATAEDNRDGDVTENITVNDNVDMKSYGKYTVTYRVKDAAGRAATEIRTVYVVRDTTTTDLHVRYNVPSPDPLPTISDVSFSNVDIDGDGPEELIQMVTKMNISWSLEQALTGSNALYTFQMGFSTEPWNESVPAVTSFSEEGPAMTITGSSVPGLDGTYYVTYDGEEFIWVDQGGQFAIIWTE